MGGLIILSAILIPTLLFARLDNVYILLMIISTIWLGAIGFLDDYIKVFKKNKEGLAGRFKIIGQIGIGLIVGATLYFNQNVVIKEKIVSEKSASYASLTQEGELMQKVPTYSAPEKSLKTTIPFFKNNEFSYEDLLFFVNHPTQIMLFFIFAFVI